MELWLMQLSFFICCRFRVVFPCFLHTQGCFIHNSILCQMTLIGSFITYTDTHQCEFRFDYWSTPSQTIWDGVGGKGDGKGPNTMAVGWLKQFQMCNPRFSLGQAGTAQRGESVQLEAASLSYNVTGCIYSNTHYYRKQIYYRKKIGV